MNSNIYLDVRFQTMGAVNCFPQIHNYTVEARFDSSYHCKRRLRMVPKCLFDLTIEGRGIFCDANGTHELSPGLAFICAMDDPDISYYYPHDAHGSWRFLWICFSGGNTVDMLKSIISHYGNICEMSLNSGYIRNILSLDNAIQGIVSLTPAASAKMVMDLLAAIENAMLDKGNPHSDKEKLIIRAQKLALESIESGVSIADIAKQLNISREHLSRLFRERTDTTFNDWLLKQKILHASKLMQNPNITCKELAWRLGYSCQTNFSRAFQKETGMTPTQFKTKGASVSLLL